MCEVSLVCECGSWYGCGGWCLCCGMRCVRYPYFVSVVAGMGVVVGASVVVTTQDGGVHTELLSSPVNPKTWKKFQIVYEYIYPSAK